jgi:signal transduction histidine kinase
MHEVVNLMLDVTRIDSETVKVAFIPTQLRQVARDVAASLAKSAAERRITLTVEDDPDTPGIHADPTLIQKALYHLIVNAVKYTPDGGTVTVRLRPVRMDDDALGAEISVKDTGIGLDAEHHELVFEKFYQVGDVAIHSSGKTTFKGGGPGVGLAIVRGVARVHGGKTWVESAGHDEVHFPGSVFYLQLPVNPPEPHP